MAKMTVRGDKILIEIDASKIAFDNAPMSSSGKTKLLSSDSEKVSVNGREVRVALNAMFKPT